MTALDNTVLLINFDNGLADLGYYSHTLAAAGSAAVSTAKAKFGNKSLLLTADADTLTISDSSAFTFSDSDFTIEMWVYYASSVPTGGTYYSQYVDSNNYITLDKVGAAALEFRITAGGVSQLRLTGTGTLAADTWHHLALCRNGDIWTLYQDGAVIDSDTVTYTIANLAAGILIDPLGAAGTAYIDDVRVINGTAAYTAAFAVPSAGHTINSGFDQLAIDHAGAFFDSFGEKVVYNPSGGTPRLIDAIIERLPPGPLGTLSQSIRANITVRNAPTSGIDPGDDNPLEDTVTLEPEKGHARVTWPLSFKRNQDAGLVTYEL